MPKKTHVLDQPNLKKGLIEYHRTIPTIVTEESRLVELLEKSSLKHGREANTLLSDVETLLNQIAAQHPELEKKLEVAIEKLDLAKESVFRGMTVQNTGGKVHPLLWSGLPSHK
jgi:hypothetical protein